MVETVFPNRGTIANRSIRTRRHNILCLYYDTIILNDKNYTYRACKFGVFSKRFAGMVAILFSFRDLNKKTWIFPEIQYNKWTPKQLGYKTLLKRLCCNFPIFPSIFGLEILLENMEFFCHIYVGRNIMFAFDIISYPKAIKLKTTSRIYLSNL